MSVIRIFRCYKVRSGMSIYKEKLCLSPIGEYNDEVYVELPDDFKLNPEGYISHNTLPCEFEVRQDGKIVLYWVDEYYVYETPGSPLHKDHYQRELRVVDKPK